MFELNNKVRLIDVSEFPIDNCDEFVGFVLGIVSQDHDLEQMYFDSFLNIAQLEGKDIEGTVGKLDTISEKYGIKFVLSVSIDEKDIPESMKSKIIVSL